MAVAIFTPRSNSQDFDERRVPLTESIKIGRSVAKIKSSRTNCIFDCKVLSRNHAIIWYEGGTFYLQDTKSSNGTFVNNTRLSKGAEESEPKELYSGDIVQFGVEVVENSKGRAVTHGCIIATLTLFSPDGQEVTRNVKSSSGGSIQSYELFQLSQFIQDALHREQILENKIAMLQRIIADAQTTTEETFESVIQEDKLLTRLETLENHLDIVTKNCSQDEMKQEIIRLHDDKNKYEMTAKESLRKVTEEKLKAIEKLSQLEKSCNNAEDECSHYQSLYERAQKELEDLVEKHRQRMEEMRTLHDQVDKSERMHIALEEQMNKERESTNEKLNVASKKELEYISRLESLQAECDFRKEQLVAMRSQIDKKKADNHIQENGPTNTDTINSITLVHETIQVLKGKLCQLQEESKLKQELVNSIKAKLDSYENDEIKDESTDLESLQKELLESEEHLKRIRENIHCLEEQLMSCHHQAVDNLEQDTNSIIVNNDNECTTDFRNHVSYSGTDNNGDYDVLYELEAQLLNITNLLKTRSKTDDDIEIYDENSDTISLKCLRHVNFIKAKVEALSCQQSSDLTGGQTILELREQLDTAEKNASEVRQEILALRDKLLEEQETARNREEVVAQLKSQVEELTRSKSLSDLEKTTEHRVAESAKSTAKHMQKQAAMSAEKASKNKVLLRTLQEENKFLLQRIQTLESELKWFKKEKQILSNKGTHDQTTHESRNSLTPSQDGTGLRHDSLQDKPSTSKTIEVLQEQDSRLKYCLLPMFFLLLAILVTFAFGILGSTRENKASTNSHNPF